MHSLWLILSSVFFGVAGVYCFIHPDMAMEAVALYIGFLVCFSGLSQLLRYGSTPAEARSRWQLVMAVLECSSAGGCSCRAITSCWCSSCPSCSRRTC